ncbi:hypothetical protein C8R48DRAFT_712179 [Suillus tomentosus]|nr:hypothetical protein C8R48DRAFT_712179 [Suillus tomentosus]
MLYSVVQVRDCLARHVCVELYVARIRVSSNLAVYERESLSYHPNSEPRTLPKHFRSGRPKLKALAG